MLFRTTTSQRNHQFSKLALLARDHCVNPIVTTLILLFFRYGSPGTPSSMIRTSAGLPKTQNSSPTPANPQVWPMRQQSQTEGYQAYNQISPSRSPSGPTYTQLSSGINTRTAYHTATSAQQQGPQPGEMIIWIIC